jgi:hypothetical protein
MAWGKVKSMFTGPDYDDLMIDAGQILIAMVAVLMRHIGSCTTTDDLSNLFNNHAAMSFARAVNKYIAAACEGVAVTIQDQMGYTYRMSRDIRFLDIYQKKLLIDIHAKFETHFTRVVPGAGAAAGEDLWKQWTNRDISLGLINEFFGSVFLFYYLRAMKDEITRHVYLPKTFLEIEIIRLCLFRNPQFKIGESADDKAYYGTPGPRGGGHYSMLMDEIPGIAPIRAFCMLCQNTGILGLVGTAQQVSSGCSSPAFAGLCRDFMHVPTVLPLLETMSRNLRAELRSGAADERFIWRPDIDPDRAKQLYDIIKTVAGIFMDSRIKIEDFKITECSICYEEDTQRRFYNTGRTAGLIVGPACRKLCPNSRTICTSSGYGVYRAMLAQLRDSQQRDAVHRDIRLRVGWDKQMPENLRCPHCSTGSFGANMVPFIVVDKEIGGITLHPVIDQLMRVIIEMQPASAEKWGPILDQRAIKPSLKSIIEEFKNIFGSLFMLDRFFYFEDNHEIRRKRWILLTTIFDNPELAHFIPTFVVLQKGDIYCQFYNFFETLEEISRIEDQHQAMLDEQADREAARRAWEEERAGHPLLGDRRRSRSPPREGGRLNRRTKKRSHGKNLPKSKTKPKSKSKSKKSKKYNKTRSNRL